jgi:plasmid segregation protein ParM
MINAGLDIGNGYVKGLVKNPAVDDKAQAVDMPSAAAVITNSADVRISEPSAIAEEFKDIYNNLEISFDSPLIDDKETHMYVGKRAVRSGKSLQEFNLKESRRSKSETELSAILTLSIIAGKTLHDYYVKNNKLPEKEEVLHADATIAISLPIEEYKLSRVAAARNYTAKPHLVRIHNFQNTVRVDIHVKEVTVAPEGASAQFAIAKKGEKFMNALVSNMIANGIDLPADITPADIMMAGGIIGIDIGEGTVNFPIYQDLKFNPDTSSTFNKGYGNVMDESLARLTQMGRPFDSRKKLVDWLIDSKDKPLMRAKRAEAMNIVDAEINIFTEELNRKFATVLERNGAFAEVVYVYGGGATPVQKSLYPKLIKTIKKTFGEDAFMPILYLDSSYSRCLNRDGLYLLAASSDIKSTEDLSV